MAREKAASDKKVRFEPGDVPPLLPLWLASGLGLCVILVLVGVALGYPLANNQPYRGPLEPLPSAPRLEVAPAAHLARYQKDKELELQGSKLPIEGAMRTTAQQGWGPPK